MEKLKSCLKEKETQLSECIIRFLLLHPDGVCLNELEDEFGESSTLLSNLMDKLAETGKI